MNNNIKAGLITLGLFLVVALGFLISYLNPELFEKLMIGGSIVFGFVILFFAIRLCLELLDDGGLS